MHVPTDQPSSPKRPIVQTCYDGLRYRKGRWHPWWEKFARREDFDKAAEESNPSARVPFTTLS